MAKKAGITETDLAHMDRALQLARKGLGKTSPNPMVGAVIVKNGKVIAEGYHKGVGKAHAEVDALKKAKGLAVGATMYVTLEPCCHYSHTGPCTKAILAAGIKKVVYAVKDPDPRVNGKGARQLRRDGIEAVGGVRREEAVRLNEAYFTYNKTKRPLIILKTAQSLDGRIATSTGDSQWISGEESLKYAHRLRAEADAVVVGMGTVKLDNPALTVRRVKGRNPYRIVISNSLDFPKKCQLLDKNKDYKTIIASNSKSITLFTKKHPKLKLIFWDLKTTRRGLIDLNDFVDKAATFGIRSLLIEGGSRLITSFLKAGLLDKYIQVSAPMLIGQGKSTIGDLGFRKLSEAITFSDHSFENVGRDILFVGYPDRKK